jgi:hypothetical protein
MCPAVPGHGIDTHSPARRQQVAAFTSWFEESLPLALNR